MLKKSLASFLLFTTFSLNSFAIPYGNKDIKNKISPINPKIDKLLYAEEEYFEKYAKSCKNFQKFYRDRTKTVKGEWQEIGDGRFFLFVIYDIGGDGITDVIEVFKGDYTHKKQCEDNPYRYIIHQQYFNKGGGLPDYIILEDYFRDGFNGNETIVEE